MGTRADFYVRLKPEPDQKPVMAWIGSIAMDGYPSGFDDQPGIQMQTAKVKKELVAAVEEILYGRDDATTIDRGWPWPWSDSTTTDYAYVFDEEKEAVDIFCFGSPWTGKEEEDEMADSVVGYFPNMDSVANVTYGKRSGLIVISV